jgi:precorrin-2 dehydrogenase/sirohydrochlorin ferrochelatase
VAPDAPFYPVSLRVEAQPCLVVGGGPVAARKVAGLVACGAAVTVVAPSVHPDIEELARVAPAPPAGTVALARRPYRAGEAQDYRLVITATGIGEVDAAVAADAQAAGVWINTADDAGHCTFILPSVHRDGPVSIAVSTSGTSPALAAWLRRRIGSDVGPDLGTLAGLLQEARRALAAGGRSTESVDWRAVLDGPLPDLVRAGRLDEARRLLRAASDPAPPPPPR